MRFIDSTFPLIIAVSSPIQDEASVRLMIAGCERYFARGERYALLTCSPPGGQTPDAKVRKMITDWANEPRTRAASARCCVGSATVVEEALHRGALTALLWLWKPAAPHKAVASREEGLDWCLEKLASANIPISRSREQLLGLMRRELPS